MEKTDRSKLTNKITPDILIAELIELYPQVVDILIDEYELHCVTCVLASFETLREGAEAHNIIGKEFKTMLKRLNSLIN
jgi:hybrid cluster-associated redox disulfide protein